MSWLLILFLIVCVFYCFVFVFKQKTAYEMRISDWSSDVCSSDLDVGDWTACDIEALRRDHGEAYDGWRAGTYTPAGGETWDRFCGRIGGAIDKLDRKSVVSGTRVSVRVELGGRRFIKKKRKQYHTSN